MPSALATPLGRSAPMGRHALWWSASVGAVIALAALQSWWLALAGLLALAIVGWAVRYPDACWMLLAVVLLGFFNLVPFLQRPLFFWASLFLFASSAWLSVPARRQPIDLIDGPFWILAAAWLFWAAWSTLYAHDPMAGIKEVSRHVISFLILLTYVIWLRDRAHAYRLLLWLERACVGMALLYLGNAWLRGVTGHALLAWIGTAPPSPAELGQMFASMVPLRLARLFAARSTRRVPQLLALGVLAAGVVASHSRTAILSMGVGVLVLWWLRAREARRRALTPVLVAAALMGAGVFAYHFAGRPEALSDFLSGRNLVWSAALRAMREHPWVGTGPGNWGGWFSRHYVSADFLLHDSRANTFALTPTVLRGEAHNLFLTKGAESGWLSLVLLIALIVRWFVVARRALRATQPDRGHAITLACVAAMVGMVAFALFEDGPIIGRARSEQIVVVWLIAVIPWLSLRGRAKAAALPGEGAP